MAGICRNIFFLPRTQKRWSGRTVLSWSSHFSLAPQLCLLCNWFPPLWPPRPKRVSSASPAASLRGPPLRRPDSCCTPSAGKMRESSEKCSADSAGRKSGKELFTPSKPCQCCELSVTFALHGNFLTSLRLIVCWFDFTFVCWLCWHKYLLRRLRINWEAEHNMVTQRGLRVRHRQPWLPRLNFNFGKWIIISLFFKKMNKVSGILTIYWQVCF